MATDTLKFGFGPFQLLPARRTLLHDDQPVPLGGRAFDILTLLLERAGEVVSKEDLIAHAWPRSFVEESNLRVHVSALRKALGESAPGQRYIENVAGRGYSFVAPVALLEGELAARALAEPLALAHVRRRPMRIIGRGEVLATLGAELHEQRLLTIVGPGGIGKTTVACALAERSSAGFADGVALLDLTVISDPQLLPCALASILCLPVMASDPLAGIRLHLRRRELLLVLDNCEHLADAVAELADELLACAPNLRILATSREAIGLPYEHVFRLPSLAVPSEHLALGEDAVASFSALALFAERAAGSVDADHLAPADLRLIAQICRRLDGLPLSIELAAARAEVLGLRRLAAGLDDGLGPPARHRRRDARHQTLRAVLDWSYALLAPAEQRMLQNLSVYRDVFTIDCARAVGGVTAGGNQAFGAELLFNLAAKSLLACECDGHEVRYRMLETTRSYAAGKLAQGVDHAAVRRAHALRCLDLMAQAQQDWETLDTQRWQARYSRRVADVRAALDWCFGSSETELGVQLTSASSLLWIELSLLDEQRLAILRALPFAVDPTAEMALQAGLGNALYHLNGPRAQTTAAFARAYELARALGDTVELARTYSGLCAIFLLDGSYPQAQALGHVFAPYRNRSPEPVAHVIYDRMMALTLHFSGRQREARFHAERVYRAPSNTQRNTRTTGVQYDQQVAAATVLGRIRWVEGCSEQAAALAAEAVERALAIDHPVSLCYALAVGGCPVALWNGETRVAADYVALLGERARQHALPQWQAWAFHLRAVCEGDPLDCVRGQPLATGPQAETMYTLVPGLAGPGEYARIGQGLSGWCAPELLRQKALWLQQLGHSREEVEAVLGEAMALADGQGALAWELRAAVTLAELWRTQGRIVEAHEMLAGVARRFPPGRPSRDQRNAASLLDQLASRA